MVSARAAGNWARQRAWRTVRRYQYVLADVAPLATDQLTDMTCIDGDGKDDYIWLSESGAATVYINVVSVQKNIIFLKNKGPQPDRLSCRASVPETGLGDPLKELLANDPCRVEYHAANSPQIGINPAKWVPLNDGTPVATGYVFTELHTFADFPHVNRDISKEPFFCKMNIARSQVALEA